MTKMKKNVKETIKCQIVRTVGSGYLRKESRMKLLIDIDDEAYNSLRKGFSVMAGRGNGKTVILQAIIPIMTGTPIPDSCRLIDANDYIAQCACFGWLDTISVDEFNSCTPTIGGNANNNG